jgi:hypothetical protein
MALGRSVYFDRIAAKSPLKYIAPVVSIRGSAAERVSFCLHRTITLGTASPGDRGEG